MDKKDKIRLEVSERYAGVVRTGSGCGCKPEPITGCCGTDGARTYSGKVGYSEAEMAAVPDGANLGLGCGNPGAIAALQPGEVVVDLGAGGGFDCFLAAQKVGEQGRVIGVDMTPDMIARARENAARDGLPNVEFRLGEIEHLPVADASVDVIISNCVVNLSPDKPQVYGDAFRVLKPGGRIALSDTVRLRDMPDEWKDNSELRCKCVLGASSPDEIRAMLERAGFVDIEIEVKEQSKEFIKDWSKDSGVENVISSADIRARKPE